jgi:gas vesicle protein
MRSTGSFLLGALLGGIIGAAAALVLAPAPGNKLRDQVRDYVGSVRNQINQAAITRRAQLEHELAMLRSPNPPHA